jgi:hypothetical protein
MARTGAATPGRKKADAAGFELGFGVVESGAPENGGPGRTGDGRRSRCIVSSGFLRRFDHAVERPLAHPLDVVAPPFLVCGQVVWLE